MVGSPLLHPGRPICCRDHRDDRPGQALRPSTALGVGLGLLLVIAGPSLVMRSTNRRWHEWVAGYTLHQTAKFAPRTATAPWGGREFPRACCGAAPFPARPRAFPWGIGGRLAVRAQVTPRSGGRLREELRSAPRRSRRQRSNRLCKSAALEVVWSASIRRVRAFRGGRLSANTAPASWSVLPPPLKP